MLNRNAHYQLKSEFKYLGIINDICKQEILVKKKQPKDFSMRYLYQKWCIYRIPMEITTSSR